MNWGLVLDILSLSRAIIPKESIKGWSYHWLQDLFQIVCCDHSSGSCTLKDNKWRLPVVADGTPYHH
jgi:hypothetical protein